METTQLTTKYTVTKEIPVLRGEVVSTCNWNNGTVAITTTYGLYCVYRNQDQVDIKLLAVFEKED